MKKNNNLSIKHPIELELTDFCPLKCICCPNKDYKEKGFISDKDFYITIDYVKNNIDNILFLDLCGVGDIFLHPNLENYLDYIGDAFSGTTLEILIPTKGVIVNDKYLKKLKLLKEKNINFNISIGFYSMRREIHDKISGVDSFDKMLKFIKKLQDYKIGFSLELLINKFSINELEYFYRFGDSLGVNYKVHNYHNFGGSLDKSGVFDYNSKDYKFKCSFADDETYELDFYCKYTLPFIARDGYLFSCSHSGKQEKYRTEKISELFEKFPKYLDLLDYITTNKLNKNICKNCTYFKYNHE